MLGMGPPFALATKALHPEWRVVLLSGDGAFGLNRMELEPAVRFQLPCVCVVGNGGGWGMIRSVQQTVYGRERPWRRRRHSRATIGWPRRWAVRARRSRTPADSVRRPSGPSGPVGSRVCMLFWIPPPTAAQVAVAWPSEGDRARNYEASHDAADDARSCDAWPDTHRAGHDGVRGGSRRPLLGGPDPAVAPALPHRRGAVPAGDDPSLRCAQEGMRAGQRVFGPPARGEGPSDREGRRGGHRGPARRPLPAGGVANG